MVHKTNLTPPLFIGVPVTSQEGERAYMCVCVEGVDFASVFLHFCLLDCGTVPTVWIFLFFEFEFRCSTPLSAIFQLYHGDQF